MQRRKFSREFKLEAVKLVRERGVSPRGDRAGSSRVAGVRTADLPGARSAPLDPASSAEGRRRAAFAPAPAGRLEGHADLLGGCRSDPHRRGYMPRPSGRTRGCRRHRPLRTADALDCAQLGGVREARRHPSEVWMPRKGDPQVRHLERDEFERFFAQVKAPHARLYMLLGHYTMARRARSWSSPGVRSTSSVVRSTSTHPVVSRPRRSGLSSRSTSSCTRPSSLPTRPGRGPPWSSGVQAASRASRRRSRRQATGAASRQPRTRCGTRVRYGLRRGASRWPSWPSSWATPTTERPRSTMRGSRRTTSGTSARRSPISAENRDFGASERSRFKLNLRPLSRFAEEDLNLALFRRSSRLKLVGERGFEPPAPASRRQCSTRLSYSPTEHRSFASSGPTGGAKRGGL